jgi:hypothetical protein
MTASARRSRSITAANQAGLDLHLGEPAPDGAPSHARSWPRRNAFDPAAALRVQAVRARANAAACVGRAAAHERSFSMALVSRRSTLCALVNVTGHDHWPFERRTTPKVRRMILRSVMNEMW